MKRRKLIMIILVTAIICASNVIGFVDAPTVGNIITEYVVIPRHAEIEEIVVNTLDKITFMKCYGELSI